VLDYAFGVLRLPRVAFAVDATNDRSLRVMRRRGFRRLSNLHPSGADSLLRRSRQRPAPETFRSRRWPSEIEGYSDGVPWRKAASWRGVVVGSLLGLWLAIGIAWGARAAVIFAFFAFLAVLFAAWAALTGRFSQAAGGWYYDRQMGSGASGRRRRHGRRR
jgi:hypothetical protein